MAHERLQHAQDAYEHALAIAWDTDLSPDGVLALHQHGRTYATAVIAYSDAVMALLSHMETTRENTRTHLRDTGSSEQQQS